MKNYVLFDNVLGDERSSAIYQLALQKRELFSHSKTTPNREYPDWRKSFVLYDWELRPVLQLIEQELHARLPYALTNLGIPRFDVSSMEIQLTSHNDGEYYHWHTDSGTEETRSRVVTFVYYFHSQPRQFSGGELVLYDEESAEEIEPVHDRLVMFDSRMKHEVKVVTCPSKQFENSRFTLNGWVRRRSTVTADYFDAKIFSYRGSLPTNPLPNRPAPVATVEKQQTQTVTAEVSANGDSGLGARALDLLELYGNLFRDSRSARSIATHTQISADEFFERYYFMNRPVLLKGVMSNSPAVRTWTPNFFAEHYGSVQVGLTADRNLDPEYEWKFKEIVRDVTLREFVDRLRREPESNDYYLVARNMFFDQPALEHLRRDLEPPADIINRDDYGPATMKLWFGPKGTLTPLHHDLHSILFAQVFGTKHVKLIPPFDTAFVYPRKRFYSGVDPENVDVARFPKFLKATVLDVIVEPGDVLLLPVGWWHWVRALDVSISATFCSFTRGTNTVLRLPADE
jgi:Rps23 Pro-64 3,4-dihydroxylase Tpa1-like proline 4-hydroxylase